MQQDITESLRIQATNLKHTAGKHVADLLNEAADEIERLRNVAHNFENRPKWKTGDSIFRDI